MRKFDALIAQHVSDNPTLREAIASGGDGTLSSMAGNALGAVSGGTVAGIAPTDPNKGVYYLVGGSKSLPALKTAIVATGKPGPYIADFFDENGAFVNQDAFGVNLYNAFNTVVGYGRNYVPIANLMSPSKIYGTTSKSSVDVNQGNFDIPVHDVFESIKGYITSKNIQHLVKFVTPEQAAIMDKGGLGKRIKTGFDKMAGEQIRTAGNLAGKVNYN